LEGPAEEIGESAEIDSNVTAVQGDVSNLDDLYRLYKEVAAKKGKLDVLFANAGVVEPIPTAAVSRNTTTRLSTSMPAACSLQCKRPCP
jgi:NAD(P)-dependent dehydrogenase (short-subunit alcohol dehydrogenase family)